MDFRSSRLLRAAASGVAATAVDAIVLVALVELAALEPGWAAAASAAIGACVNFTASKWWAFRDHSPVTARQAAAFVASTVGTSALSGSAVHGLVALHLHYVAARLCAAVAVFLVWTYPSQSRVVFGTISRSRTSR